MRPQFTDLLAALVPLCLMPGGGAEVGRHPDLLDADFHFNTFFCSWSNITNPELVKFLRAARPEIVQVGFYGPMFHGYADNPQSTGGPMELPVVGQREALEAQQRVNEQIHELGLRVVGHFQMVRTMGNPERWDDFFDFYDNRWLEDVLGPKPHPDVRELLQRDAQGDILVRKGQVDSVGPCMSSPYARQMLKQMLKVAIDAGVDGILTNFNCGWGCLCHHCQTAFKEYLSERYTSEELLAQFGIENLESHKFERIPASGYPDPETATPLDWEALCWNALLFKEAYDEILIDYGRLLKPDLILATWDHLRDLVGEERAFTPIDLWGRGENYFWYSGSGTTAQLAEHQAGYGSLCCLYVREMGGGKPFILCKFETTRIRNAIAEAAATGGGGMGLEIPYRDPVGYEVGVRYLRFLHAHKKLYWPVESFAEVGLLFPRQSALNGHREGVDAFRSLGHALIDEHILLDVVADEKLTEERLARYELVILPVANDLSDKQIAIFERYVRSGGRLLVLGDCARADEKGKPRAKPALLGIYGPGKEWLRAQFGQGRLLWLPKADVAEALAGLKELAEDSLSKFEASWTLRVSAFSQPDRLLLHLVNYNRDEALAQTLSGPAAECPLPAENVGVSLSLPKEARISAVTLLSPDEPRRQKLAWQVNGARLELRVPRVLAYGVVEVHFAKG